MDRTKGFPQLQYPSPPPPRVLQRSLHPPYCLPAGEHYLLRLQIHSEDGDDRLIFASWHCFGEGITLWLSSPSSQTTVVVYLDLAAEQTTPTPLSSLVINDGGTRNCCVMLFCLHRTHFLLCTLKTRITPLHGFSAEQREGLLIVLYSCTLAHVILC